MTDKDDLMMPRPVRDSQSEMAEIVLPNDANPLGALLGGRLMQDRPGWRDGRPPPFAKLCCDCVHRSSGLLDTGSRGRSCNPALLRESCVPHFDGSRREGIRRELSA